jgi:large subunit ribosomal protein L2
LFYNYILTFQSTKTKKIILSRNFLWVFKFKPLRFHLKTHLGKDNQGHYTIFSKGSRFKNMYNYIDIYRTLIKVPGIIVGNFFDNYRSIFLGLVKYINGSFSYIMLPHNLNIGQLTQTTNIKSKKNNGFCQPLYSLNMGVNIFNVEFSPGSGGKIARSSGTSCKVIRRLDLKVLIKLPSQKVLKLSKFCLAHIGQSSNIHKNLEVLNRFSFRKKLGFKSTVSGESKNPVDHPHGGTTKGGKPKMNPWGHIFK